MASMGAVTGRELVFCGCIYSMLAAVVEIRTYFEYRYIIMTGTCWNQTSNEFKDALFVKKQLFSYALILRHESNTVAYPVTFIVNTKMGPV